MVGLKNVTMSEDFLEFHFPRYPIMPGALILEALVQLSAWLEAASSDFARWLLLEKVQSVKFYGFSLPGDQIDLRIEISEIQDGLRPVRATATVKGERKVAANFSGRVVDLDRYEDPEEQRHHFQLLLREIPLI